MSQTENFAQQMPIDNHGISVVDVMPHNEEAEQGLLGALLFDNKALEAVADIIEPEHFYFPINGRIYSLILEFSERGLIASPVTLAKHLGDQGLHRVGGKEYLVGLYANVISVLNAKNYAQHIRDLYIRRSVIDICRDGIYSSGVYGDPEGAETVLSGVEEQLFRLSETSLGEAGPQPIEKGVQESWEQIERAQRGEARGVKSGIKVLDDHLNGFAPADLIIGAGRPGMGKTAWALTIALNAAIAGVPVLFFSLEMSAQQLTQRLIARLTGFPIQQQNREGGLSNEDFRKVINAGERLKRLPFYIDDAAGVNMHQIRTRIRRHKRRHNIRLVFIDYLGLIVPDKHITQKVYQIQEITQDMKRMAKDIDIPVVCLHQLSREVEKRDNKRPQLADLRDSGSIEQDADIVVFLYRPEYYLSRDEPVRKANTSDEKFAEEMLAHAQAVEGAKGKAEIIIGKFRQGDSDKILRCAFDGRKQLFHDFDLPNNQENKE